MDMRVQEPESVRAAIRLKTEHFDLVTRVLGFDNDTARAYLIGMHPVTVGRVKRGAVAGVAFIANTIHALRRYAEELAKFNLTANLDDLFEVVEATDVDGAE